MKEIIEKSVTKALKELGFAEVPFTVEHPSDINHGDYAVNVAMILSKMLKDNPRAIAEKIVAKLKSTLERYKQ